METGIAGVLVLEPRVFGDGRGFFFESWNRDLFAAAAGVDPVFVQDNHSSSIAGVLRGLHYQVDRPQGKLVRVVRGSVFDVVVDLRAGSPSYGAWVGTELSEENRRELWVPPGLAHGFYVTADRADVLYKTTDYYSPGGERSLLWSDAALAIAWPIPAGAVPVLSAKDAAGMLLRDAEPCGVWDGVGR